MKTYMALKDQFNLVNLQNNYYYPAFFLLSKLQSRMSENNSKDQTSEQVRDQKKRKLITTAAFATAGIGAACAAIPFIDSMNPASSVSALASIEVDVSGIEVGAEKTVTWRGKPIFIKRRTAQEIAAAQDVDLSELKDPQKDSDRVKPGKEEWLVTVGICTHLGCVPMGNAGEFNGWFCPCHGSVYDTSARIRKGPAPTNLAVPPYEFLTDTTIKIG
ncbi:MAG: ubiquinol-cytochrome c reductase iron-sulfur subunit [Rickettsiales bacterium]|jgi:ubiquinol-cytochrome c reductase iron-sulfur subunit